MCIPLRTHHKEPNAPRSRLIYMTYDSSNVGINITYAYFKLDSRIEKTSKWSQNVLGQL